jgi:hypothetical protein
VHLRGHPTIVVISRQGIETPEASPPVANIALPTPRNHEISNHRPYGKFGWGNLLNLLPFVTPGPTLPQARHGLRISVEHAPDGSPNMADRDFNVNHPWRFFLRQISTPDGVASLAVDFLKREKTFRRFCWLLAVGFFYL